MLAKWVITSINTPRTSRSTAMFSMKDGNMPPVAWLALRSARLIWAQLSNCSAGTSMMVGMDPLRRLNSICTAGSITSPAKIFCVA
ncbi:hypothetical protein D3C87_1929470 [compost metagenome]